ncbi:LamB/YcsF family protein [Streptomyces shenzhenensis]|uniref:LamB/YcsF family protein n=1 Tax=Streptomyces shenzhenensis TaxID=943815 RepID=UPI0038014C0D
MNAPSTGRSSARDRIDVNCDIGEGFGRWRMPFDAELMAMVSSVSVAAGFHAGDPSTIRRTVESAVTHGLDIGVHVGLPDLQGFGRRRLDVTAAEVRDICTYQIGAVDAFVRAAGRRLAHVKPHGALYGMIAADADLAAALAQSVAEFDRNLRIFLLRPDQRTILERYGVRLVVEGFPELEYDDDGMLILEREKQVWDPKSVLPRALDMIDRGFVTARSGRRVSTPVETLCIHSDGPNALDIAQRLSTGLAERGIRVAPLSAS